MRCNHNEIHSVYKKEKYILYSSFFREEIWEGGQFTVTKVERGRVVRRMKGDKCERGEHRVVEVKDNSTQHSTSFSPETLGQIEI